MTPGLKSAFILKLRNAHLCLEFTCLVSTGTGNRVRRPLDPCGLFLLIFTLAWRERVRETDRGRVGRKGRDMRGEKEAGEGGREGEMQKGREGEKERWE